MKAETKCSLQINPLRNITRTFHRSELAMVYGYDLPAQYIQVCAVGMMCVCVCVCVCVQTGWCRNSAWAAHVSTVRNAVSSEKTRNRMNSPLQTETAGGGGVWNHITNHLTIGRSRDTERGRALQHTTHALVPHWPLPPTWAE